MIDYLNQSKIRGSIAAYRKRRCLLAKVLQPVSRSFLQSVLCTQRTQQVLDLGCGMGASTLMLGDLLSKKTNIRGVDMNRTHLQIAKERAMKLERNNIVFRYQNILEWQESNTYDYIYSRLLFDKVSEINQVLKNVYGSLKRGGCILIEELDHSNYSCHPHCYAFDRYMEIYSAFKKNRVINTEIGKQLVSTLKSLGFQKIQMRINPPLILTESNRKITSLSLKSISPLLINEQLLTPIELQNLLHELQYFEQQEESLIALPNIYQVWGYKEW